MHYAHSLAGEPTERWQELREHLEETAKLAEEFAGAYAPGWGRLAGLWHDAGKYQSAFQRRIGAGLNGPSNERVDHSSVGALLAQERGAPPLALIIAGHHGGLRNLEDVRSRLAEKRDLLSAARRDGLPPELETLALPQTPPWKDKRERALWIRFVFSALVDADFLDTERFCSGRGREFGYPPLGELKARLDGVLREKARDAKRSGVNAMRARVLSNCRQAAAAPPGAFTLTVPTGGGKTLASMAFALDHAVRHGLERVIVVIPYTSIIEQTARAYREALGEDVVIEHHSSVEPDRETPASRLASENWDAPVVVTTGVQFFESLYANRVSRCRKLHRIAGSVVVFDEVQTFPPPLLQPIRHALERVISNYGVSAVFCTATQPALELPGIREIVADRVGEFETVRGRCDYVFPDSEEPVSWEALATELRGRDQALAIVHRRDDAETLARLVSDDCIHLSSRLCAAHRTVVIDEIRRRLGSGEMCRAVSTQLVEAGVDVDFPEVWRAFAGADSLAQAAGRCNREGTRDRGLCHIFFPPTNPPRGILRVGFDVAFTMWKEERLDLYSPATFVEYFERLYARVETDPGVLAAEDDLRFEDAAAQFRMIEEHGEAVIAPYGNWAARLLDVERAIEWSGSARKAMRRLQRFIVNLYPAEIARLSASGAISSVVERLWRVNPGYEGIYDSRFGFGWQDEIAADPETFVV